MIKGPAFSRNWIIALSIIAGLGLTGCEKQATQQAAAGNAQPAATTVDVVTLTPKAVELTEQLPGRTSAYRIAEVRPQVAGIITKRLFVEGSEVKKGQVLYQIDPATYAAALESAKADLASAKASLEQYRLQNKRYADLVKQNAISRQDYEDARASYSAAQASVMAAKAAVKTAQINLDYTKIKAPISGRIGKSEVTEGALVTASQSAYLATIQQLNPLYVDISQPSNMVLKIRQRAKAQAADKGLDTPKLTGIKLTLDDGTKIEQQATMQFSDVSVDETTGTVSLRALLPNPDNTLLPGLYVRAKVPTDYKKDAFLIPQPAVFRDAQGNAHVYIVNSNHRAETVTVNTEEVIKGNWLVTSGVKAGDKVITTGLQKIKAGSLIAPHEVENK